MKLNNQDLVTLSFILLSLTSVPVESSRNTIQDFRVKRQVNALPLVFSYGGTFKFVIGLSIPIPITEGITVGLAMNMQFQYTEYTNASEVSQYYFIKTVASREQRDLDLEHRADERLIFYKFVSSLIEARGMHGYDCVLRAICEAAQYPVEKEGLVGEIIHILLTPDYGRSSFETYLDWDEPIAPYKDAAIAGRQMFSCPDIYSGCPEGEGFFELVTELVDE